MKFMTDPDLKTTAIMSSAEHERNIAYFSMEIGISEEIPTYSGGLGILAGDTIKSFADLKIGAVAVTLLYKKGYFFQQLDEKGNQRECACQWNPADFLESLPKTVYIEISGRKICIKVWKQEIVGTSGFVVPVFYLDTDISENSPNDRSLSHYLYGGDERCRLSQEIILGIGGVRILKELGYSNINRYHMNEGHSSLLTLELLNQSKREKIEDRDIEAVKRLCVFTTHTPVPVGHDKFGYDLVQNLLGDFVPLDLLKRVGGEDKLNLTLLALNLSHYENGVAKEHRKVSQEMFPGYHIDSITNGVHSVSWINDDLKKVLDKYISGWRSDPFSLRYALSIPREEIWAAHELTKIKLTDLVNSRGNAGFERNAFTIGFARRATAYKRPDLVFHDIDRLINISKNIGKIQLVFAGKAHPADGQGKEIIRKIFSLATQYRDHIKIAYISNYDIQVSKLLVSGVDLWLNTPRRPHEASGTSGMKAAMNGVPSLSVLDGWWIEGCIEDFTGWAIGSLDDKEPDNEREANSLYDKLEKKIVPTYYNRRHHWMGRMRDAIAINGSFFNTHRMVLQYVLNAYLY